ncbi:MAG: hypothetical protein WC916_04945 [Candidatus Woesearchaeota archaeon]
MNEDIVRTGVDELLDLLAKKNKIPMSEVATELNVPLDILQAWVDFLVEESILGIEYRFTTPYIYLNKSIDMNTENKKTDSSAKETVTIDDFKQEFWVKARKKNLPESQIAALWRNHLAQELDRKKKYFFFEANNRRLIRANELWEEYQTTLIK